MIKYPTAFSALKEQTEVFCFPPIPVNRVPSHLGQGVFAGNAPTALIKGAYISCLPPTITLITPTTTLITLKTLVSTLVYENPDCFYNLGCLTGEFGDLYERTLPSHVNVSTFRPKVSLVDIIILPAESVTIRIKRATGTSSNWDSVETEILSSACWHNWFINIAALDHGLVSVKKL